MPPEASEGPAADASLAAEAAVTAGPGEVPYFVLADAAVPYLLARVRWPDVAQAMSARNPDWLEDYGLFDLPYDRAAVAVTFPQASSVAASWGSPLHAEIAEGVPSYIRRMPANWSDLTPSERRAWGIEFVGRRRGPARRPRRPRAPQAMMPVPIPIPAAAHVDGNGNGAGLDDTRIDFAPLDDTRIDLRPATEARAASGRPEGATERRHQTRTGVDGRTYIRCGNTTITAGLVDLSEGGVRCVLPEPSRLVAPGARLDGPFLIESEITTWRICLNVKGWITWHRRAGAGAHFGVAFREMADGETEGLRRFLTAARKKRGS
jgi:PilZ domain